MADEGKNKRPESTNFRIWPGVLVITVCASLFFVMVYVVAYQVHLIPLPGIFHTLWKGESEPVALPDETTFLTVEMPAQETREGQYYAPDDPDAVLAALSTPEYVHQRIRISVGYPAEIDKKQVVVDVYRLGVRWEVYETTEDGAVSITRSDGETLYRQNTLYPDGITTNVGAYTLENLLGMPSLSAVQAIETDHRTVELHPVDKVVTVRYTTGKSSEWICRFGLDSGLLIEAQLFHDGETVYTMYTEYFDLSVHE